MFWKPNPRSTMPSAVHSKTSTGRTETKNSLIVNTTALICPFWGFVVLLTPKALNAVCDCTRYFLRKKYKESQQPQHAPKSRFLTGGGRVCISVLIVSRNRFFRAGDFHISFFLPNFDRTSNTQQNGDAPQSDPVLRRGIPRNDRGTDPVGHHPHQTLHHVRRAESLFLPRPAGGQKPLGKGRLRAGKPDRSEEPAIRTTSPHEYKRL